MSITWINDHAVPVRLDGLPDELEPVRAMVGEARVVALGAATRDSHELSVLADRLLRFLVAELGFRALALEGDDPASVLLDEYVRTGAGDPHALLAGARSFLRTTELLDVVGWVRRFNEQHPADPVRIVHTRDTGRHVGVQTGGLDTIDRMLAENVLDWHQSTGQRIVYWGGTAHTAVAPRRVLSPGPGSAGPSAGSHLREHLAAGYLSVGLTFDHGKTFHEFPAPAEGFAEAPLGQADEPVFLLDLRAEPGNAWVHRPVRTRLVGPVYDPADDAAYHLAGGTFGEWFDVVGHCREVTAVGTLDARAAGV